MTLLLLMLNGCFDGGCSFCGINPKPQGKPDFIYHGISIYNHSKMTLDNQYFHNFQYRITQMIDISLIYWDGDYKSLNGYSIEIVQDQFSCTLGNTCQGQTSQINKTIKISVEGNCIEYMALPHELGHALSLFGDPMHTNSKFRKMNPIFQDIIKDTNYQQNFICHFSLTPYVKKNENFINWDSKIGL